MEIGSYQVLFELGQGGMGTVYLGRVRGTGDFERLVAIKRQRPPRKGFDEPAERFLTEARLAGLVHHANVVGMHQAGSDAEGYYFICDYVEGQSLAALIDHGIQDDPLWPVPIVTRVMLDALAGLQAVHDASDVEGRPLRMLHRDVAADNLLVGRDGVTRLSDFGIAKSARNPLLTEVGTIRGKLPYLAPEYLVGDAIDLTFDIYAAGVTLWVALTGMLPWGDCSELQMMQAIRDEGVPSAASVGRVVLPELEAVIARACHRDPRQRFQSAREMLHALEAAASSSRSIASHVQVAEYVERVAGAELSQRRERIHARRRELDAEARRAAPALAFTPTAQTRNDSGSDAPATSEPAAPGSYLTAEVRLPLSRTLPSIAVAGALAALLLAAYVVWRPRVPAASGPATGEAVVEMAEPATGNTDRPSSLPATGRGEADPDDGGLGNRPAERDDRPPSHVSQPVTTPAQPPRARKSKRARDTTDEISTKNPYRTADN